MLLGAALLAALSLPARAQAPDAQAPQEASALAVERRCTVRSRLGPVVTPLPLELANFLLDHPDVSAAIVRAHKIAPYTITMRGPRRSWADDGEGTRGLITLVRRGERDRLYYGDGTHESSVFPSIRAEAAIAMTLKPLARPGCPDAVETSFDVYVRLKNPVLSGLVKTLRAFVGKTVVRKFGKAFLVADKVGRLMAERPDELSAEVSSLPGLSGEDRARLLELIKPLRGAVPCSTMKAGANYGE